MNCRKLICLFLLIVLPVSVQSAGTRNIDSLLTASWKRAGVEPNPPISDQVFLRRIYLDIAGRIPSLEEGLLFLDSRDPDKRNRLIDTLLESEAAVSHQFNYWADILRIKERVGNNRLQTYAYQFWLKDALRKNVPYDKIVRQLITARGWIWENGATGYYHRDRGMPLDNMSNTIRVFLGTRLECAQCHDHPFDRWTQMDYYKMAAFSYSMDTRLYAPSGRTAVAKYRGEFMEEARKKSPSGQLERGSPDYLRYRALNQVNADMFAFMKYVLSRETPQTLTLPHDYQYADAKPHDEVFPATMFGRKIDPKSSHNLVEEYADWITGPENPRFAKVIANRLWKRVMGRGLLPSDDEILEHTQSTDPELLEFLTLRMKELNYDMRAFQREIYTSDVYQRDLSRVEIPLGVPYYFPGPVLRRLTAEQIWDSMVTLLIPDPDYYMPQMDLRLAQLDRLRQIHLSLQSRSDSELVEVAKQYADRYAENYLHVESLSEQHRAAVAAGDEEKAMVVGKELNQIRNKERSELRKVIHGDRVNSGNPKSLYENFGIGGAELPLQKIKKRMVVSKAILGTPVESARWRELSGELLRASELPFPAPRGHFLREFGQSDREGIQNSSPSASVPQALTLMNGVVQEALSNPSSVLQQDIVKGESPEEKIEIMFMSLLGSKPSKGDLEIFQNGEGNFDPGIYDEILWVLLNSQRFRFLN